MSNYKLPTPAAYTQPKVNKDNLQNTKWDNMTPQNFGVKLYAYAPLVTTSSGNGIVDTNNVSYDDFINSIRFSNTVIKNYFKDGNLEGWKVGCTLKKIAVFEARVSAGETSGSDAVKNQTLGGFMLNDLSIMGQVIGEGLFDLVNTQAVMFSFEDLDNVYVEPGQSISYQYPIFYARTMKVGSVSLDSKTIFYTDFGLQRIMTRGTTINEGDAPIRWEFYKYNANAKNLPPVARIKLDIYGPFDIRYLNIIDRNGKSVALDYSTPYGDLYENLMEYQISGSKVFFYPYFSNQVLSAWNLYYGLLPVNGQAPFTVKELATNNGLFGGLTFGWGRPALQTAMNNSVDGLPNGDRTINERWGVSDGNPVPVIKPNLYDWTGDVNYLSVYLTLGPLNGLTGLGDIHNLGYSIAEYLQESTSKEGNASSLSNNVFGFFLSRPLSSLAGVQKISSTVMDTTSLEASSKNLKSEWEANIEKVKHNSEKASKTTDSFEQKIYNQRADKAIEEANKTQDKIIKNKLFKEIGGAINIAGEIISSFYNNMVAYNPNLASGEVNALPRSPSSNVPLWLSNTKTLYNLDISSNIQKIGAVNIGIDLASTSVALFISKPMRADLNFAIAQRSFSYYFGSLENHVDKAYYLNGLRNGLLDFSTAEEFPVAIYEGMAYRPTLSCFTIEKWMQYTNISGIQRGGQNFFPIQQIEMQINYLVWGANPRITFPIGYLYGDANLFYRPFNETDNIPNNKFTIFLRPVQDLGNANQTLINGVNVLMTGIYGGWKQEWTFYDIEGNEIVLGKDKDGNDIKTIVDTAANRTGNPLLISNTRIFGNYVEVESVEQFEPSVIKFETIFSDFVSSQIQFSINPKSNDGLTLNTINNVEVYALSNSTNIRYNGFTSQISQAFTYRTDFTQLLPNNVYSVVIKIDWTPSGSTKKQTTYVEIGDKNE